MQCISYVLPSIVVDILVQYKICGALYNRRLLFENVVLSVSVLHVSEARGGFPIGVTGNSEGCNVYLR